MKFDVRAMTITGAVVAAAAYAVCAIFVALAPVTAVTLGGYIVHVDISSLGRTITWGGAIAGLIIVSAFVAVVSGASGWVYNRLAKA
jgi:FtsH-binding integral membrane protein